MISNQPLTPHGPGFRFIDRFEKTGPAKGMGWKFLDPTAGFFTDHFPGNPLMPAVLVVECAAQAAGVLLMGDGKNPTTPVFLASIDQFRILTPISPGETLETKVLLEKEFGPLAICAIECSASGRAVARGKITLSREITKPQSS
jgi:3-hydroxymyristoyl/3-hydroxydecanoyl-(acyl carrier protein) dehydratase